MSDIDTVVVDSLKALDPERPIREADMSPAPAMSASGHERSFARKRSVGGANTRGRTMDRATVRQKKTVRAMGLDALRRAPPRLCVDLPRLTVL